jgi:hypothetical protein
MDEAEEMYNVEFTIAATVAATLAFAPAACSRLRTDQATGPRTSRRQAPALLNRHSAKERAD